MRVTIEHTAFEQVDADAVVVPVFEGCKADRFGAASLWESGEVRGKPLELTLLHHPSGVATPRILLAGAGKLEKWTPAELRKLAAAAIRYLKPKGVKQIALALDAASTNPEFARAAVEGAILGDFDPDRYKTDNGKKLIESFRVVPAGAASDLELAAEQGRIIAEAQNFTRGLVNEPGNRLTPAKVAEVARAR